MAAPNPYTETFAPEAGTTWYRSMPRFWHPVAYTRDLEAGKPVACQLLGRRLVAVRLDGEVRVFDDVCRHKGSSLALGWVEGGCLTCPYHGWQYDADGRVVRIPARPELSGHLDVRLGAYRCQQSAGMIWVTLAGDPFGEPAAVPEWEDPTFDWQTPDAYDWATSTPRRLENFVDFSHFPFVHENLLGTRDKPEVGHTEVWREDHVLRFSWTAEEPNKQPMKRMTGIDGDTVEVTNEYYLTMPSTIYLVRNFPNGRRYLLVMASAPTGPSTSRNFWHIGSDFASSDEDKRLLLDFELLVLSQDQPIVESQLPEHLPDQLSAELHVKIADNVTLNYRRWLLELAAELAPSPPGRSPAG